MLVFAFLGANKCDISITSLRFLTRFNGFDCSMKKKQMILLPRMMCFEFVQGFDMTHSPVVIFNTSRLACHHKGSQLPDDVFNIIKNREKPIYLTVLL